METSYIILRLQPFYSNLRKRLVKSPKLYFYDVGLASYLIGIESSSQVATHPLRGPLFENAVVAEALKYRFNRGMNPNLSFYRDSSGLECDLLYETGDGLTAIEVKSGSTVVSDYFGSLNRVAGIVPHISAKAVVYGGITRQSRSDCEVVPLGGFGGMLERMDVDQEVVAFVQENMGPEADASTPTRWMLCITPGSYKLSWTYRARSFLLKGCSAEAISKHTSRLVSIG